MAEKKFFNPLSDIEKADVLSFVNTHTMACTFKIYDSYWKSQFIKTANQSLKIYKTNRIQFQNEKIIILFEMQNDQFFFQTSGSSVNDEIHLKNPEEVFKLQRRNDFRVSIPASVTPIIVLKEYPDLKIHLEDLSLGGCKMKIKTQFALDLKIDQTVFLKLKIIDFEQDRLECTVKFNDFQKEYSSLILGLQFNNLDTEQTVILRNTLIQIDRILRGKGSE